MQKHYKFRLITNILDHEDIWCLSLNSALNMVTRSHKDSVLREQSNTMGSHRAQRPHYKAIIDEAHLSVGFLVTGVQKTWFVQMLAPETSRQQRSLTSWDVRSPGPLRKLLEMRCVSSPKPCYITTSRAGPTKKKKRKRGKCSWKKWQKWAETAHWVLTLDVQHSGSYDSFHLLVAFFKFTFGSWDLQRYWWCRVHSCFSKH